MELSLFLSIVSILVVVTNFILSIFDRGKRNKEEESKEVGDLKLIDFRLKQLEENYKSMASDIKEIKKMLDTYKETFRSIVKNEIEEHVKIYHSKE